MIKYGSSCDSCLPLFANLFRNLKLSSDRNPVIWRPTVPRTPVMTARFSQMFHRKQLQNLYNTCSLPASILKHDIPEKRREEQIWSHSDACWHDASGTKWNQHNLPRYIHLLTVARALLFLPGNMFFIFFPRCYLKNFQPSFSPLLSWRPFSNPWVRSKAWPASLAFNFFFNSWHGMDSKQTKIKKDDIIWYHYISSNHNKHTIYLAICSVQATSTWA